MSSNLGLPFMYANSRQGEAARDVAINEANTAGLKAAAPSGCGNDWAVAASIPGMIPMGNFGNSPEGGCAIDLQSRLLFGDPATARFKGPKQLFERPFATTPNLGLGSIDHIDEQSHVIFGHSTANRKSIQTVTDKQFPVFEPLIEEKAADIPDNNYFVEPFLRGGYSARLAPRTRVDLTK
uniref:Uncharacterized protein n=1 Tax=viral metagenome TaxID=1070528 RepID=A0A6C0F6N7_9ZZZZ